MIERNNYFVIAALQITKFRRTQQIDQITLDTYVYFEKNNAR